MTDNYTVFVNEEEQRIEIYFPFSWRLLEVMHDLPDATFQKANRLWWMPATPFHADKAIVTLKDEGFYLGEDVYRLASGEKKAPKFPMDKRLRPFQQKGLKFEVMTGGRCIIGDDPGTGKTPQALAYVNLCKGKTLVLSPAVVTWKWNKECGIWTSMSSGVVSTTKEPLPDADIHIMSFDIMRRRYKELMKIPYDVIVVDECHAFKDHRSQRTKALRKLIGSGITHAIYMSGTPFLNKPSELFTVLNMLDPLAFPTFTKFASRYLGAFWAEGHWNFPPHTVTNIEELKDRLKSVMIRRTKREVLPELPEKVRTIVPVKVNMKEYNKAKKDLASWYADNGKQLSGTNVLAKLSALRQIVGKEKAKYAVQMARDILQNEQVVIFAHHTEVVDAIYDALALDYRVRKIVGGVPNKKRQELCDEFLAGESDVMIISTAGGEGIDLYSASNLIMTERLWVPGKEEQVEARLDRQGQENRVNVWYLAAMGTVDERLANMVYEKRDTFGKVVSQDDILTLVQDYLEEL